MDYIDYAIGESHAKFVDFAKQNGYARFELYLPGSLGRTEWFYAPANFEVEENKFCWAKLHNGTLIKKSEWMDKDDISFSGKDGLYLVDDQMLARPHGIRLIKEMNFVSFGKIPEYDFFIVPEGLKKY